MSSRVGPVSMQESNTQTSGQHVTIHERLALIRNNKRAASLPQQLAQSALLSCCAHQGSVLEKMLPVGVPGVPDSTGFSVIPLYDGHTYKIGTQAQNTQGNREIELIPRLHGTYAHKI